jgi:hypothetical protein
MSDAATAIPLGVSPLPLILSCWAVRTHDQNIKIMKFLIQVVLTVLLSYVAEQFLPWWTIGICAAVIAMGLTLNKITAFLGGFTAISLLWMIVATLIDVRTNAILSTKIAPLLGFQSSTLLILLTGLVGGMVGGLGALSGQQLRALLNQKESKQVSGRRY